MKIRALIFMLMFPLAVIAQGQSLLSGNYGFMGSRPTFGMQMGSSFSTGFAGTGIFSQSIAPHLQFNPGKNFTLIAGSVLSTSSFGGTSSIMQGGNDRFLSTTVYALGAYQVNPLLTLTGGAWGERNNLNQMMQGPQMNPQAFNLNAGGMMMGLDFKITENLRFGAEVNVSRGANPFSPYNSYSPFYTPGPFNRRPNW
jgi:hypothetical protein